MNTEWPGLPDYMGPTEGWFTLLHHVMPVGFSRNVLERTEYINTRKPEKERAARLRHIRYLGAEEPEWHSPAWEKYSRITLVAWRTEFQEDAEHCRVTIAEAAWAEYVNAVTGKLHELIPDCRWNGKEIVFGDAQ